MEVAKKYLYVQKITLYSGVYIIDHIGADEINWPQLYYLVFFFFFIIKKFHKNYVRLIPENVRIIRRATMI